MSRWARTRAAGFCLLCAGCSAHVDVGSTQDAAIANPPRDGGRAGTGFIEAGVGSTGSHAPPYASFVVRTRPNR